MVEVVDKVVMTIFAGMYGTIFIWCVGRVFSLSSSTVITQLAAQ